MTMLGIHNLKNQHGISMDVELMVGIQWSFERNQNYFQFFFLIQDTKNYLQINVSFNFITNI